MDSCEWWIGLEQILLIGTAVLAIVPPQSPAPRTSTSVAAPEREFGRFEARTKVASAT